MTRVIRADPADRENPRMADTHPLADVVMGHQVLQILSEQGGGPIPLESLRSASATRFGASAVYGNCHGDRFDFDGLLEFLASVGKLARSGDEVALGQIPACSGHDDHHHHH